MTDKINIAKNIQYWLKTSEHDYETMQGLFKIKRYADSLFYGHIVLEKILKAQAVKTMRQEAPRTHNLAVLARTSGIDFTKEDLEFLATVNRFNMRARYPDIKLNFYKLSTAKYTKDKLNKIKKFYQTLCQNLKLKK